MTSEIPTNEAYSARYLSEAIQRIADELREIADRVDRRAGDVARVGSPGIAHYGTVVQGVINELRNGQANLMTATMVWHSTDADIARTEARLTATAAVVEGE